MEKVVLIPIRPVLTSTRQKYILINKIFERIEFEYIYALELDVILKMAVRNRLITTKQKQPK